jgi:hypothetical protein
LGQNLRLHTTSILLYYFFWVILGVRILYADVSEHSLIHLHWQVGVCVPMKMKQCSETSAYKIQTPEHYPEEIIQHSEHGESLKSRRLASSYFVVYFEIRPGDVTSCTNLETCHTFTCQKPRFYCTNAISCTAIFEISDNLGRY